MKYFWCVPVFIVLSIYCIAWTEGLDCYQCIHVDGFDKEEVPVKNFDESCKNGKKPKDSFSTECKSPSTNTSCAKVTASGKLGKKEFKATIRTCAAYSEEEKCQKSSVEDLGSQLPPEWAEIIRSVEDASVTYCTCNDDDCNSSSMLKVSSSVLAASLAFLLIKFITA